MDLNKLRKFLVKAKINTYASNGEKRERLLSDKSKEFKFEERDLKYRDRYFGSSNFIGEEIVFKKEKPIFGMNYYGGIVSNNTSKKEIYNFLKDALKRIRENKPFRGPGSFKDNNFKYTNKTKGSVKTFSGEEKIYYKKKLVYKLNYHGGIINH